MKRLWQVDATRIFFCLGIFYLHFLHAEDLAHAVEQQTFRSSWTFKFLTTGLFGFFVISGWVLSYKYFDFFKSQQNARNFFRKRIFRVWPIYFLILGVHFLFFNLSLTELLAGSVFINNYFMPFGSFGVSWSLAVEEQLYLLFPVLTLLGRKKLIGLFGAIFFLVLLWPNLIWTGSRYHLQLLLFPFLLGMIVGSIHYSKKRIWVGTTLSALFLICEWQWQFAHFTIWMSLLAFLIINLFLLVPVQASERTQKYLEYLAFLSYPFYLVHQLVIDQLARWPMDRALQLLTGFLITSALAILLDWFLYRWPLQKWKAAALEGPVSDKKHARTYSENVNVLSR